MIDQAARAVLLAGLIAALVVAVVVLGRTVRHSRRGSIWSMIPTLTIWTVFETGALLRWNIDLLRWLSRLGVIAIAATFLYQLWSIDYAEQAEKRIRDNGL